MRELITYQVELLPEIREEKILNKYFLIAPAVFAVPGILNGEMVELGELARAAVSGNGVPIVISHPHDEQGNPISANHPSVPNIGRVYNLTAMDKLKGEAWIDVDLANMTAEGQEILRRIRAGEVMENSLGWWRDLEPATQAGFSGHARNIVLDHYAILLNEEGACSINDGCGIPRVNSKGVVVNCQCQNIGGDAIAPTENKKNPPLGERILSQINKLVELIMKNNSKQRDELVGRLAAVESIGLDAEQLAALDDDVLAAFDRAVSVQDAGVTEITAEVEEVVEVEETDNDELETLRRDHDALKRQVETLTANAANQRKERRAEYISALIANASVPFSAQELEGFGDEQLEVLAAKFKPARFNGRAAPGFNANDNDYELVEAPMPSA